MRMSLLDAFRRQRLLRELEDPDPAVRIAAADMLADSGERRAVRALVEGLHRPENQGLVQARFVHALGRLGAGEAVPHLLLLLTGRAPASDAARRRAAEALGEIRAPVSIRPLLGFLAGERGADPPDESLRERVREALVAIAREDPAPLVAALGEREEGVRVEAMMALSRIGDPSAIPHFVRALSDLNFEIRIMAAMALAELGTEEEIAPLSRVLKDVNRDVRAAAKDAIIRIRSRRRG